MSGSKAFGVSPFGVSYNGFATAVSTTLKPTWDVVSFISTALQPQWESEGYLATSISQDWGFDSYIGTTLFSFGGIDEGIQTVLRSEWAVGAISLNTFCLPRSNRKHIIKKTVFDCSCEDKTNE